MFFKKARRECLFKRYLSSLTVLFFEKMLSLKYLIFNTSFIIFNNSTKLYAI